jgi:hypothetical protein
MNTRVGNRIWAVAAGLVLAAVAAVCATSALAGADYGPDTCLNGFAWRGAVATDHVCVTPDVRTQTAQDNYVAAARRSPTGGPYGTDTCVQGYVWREAFAGDHVCVTPTARSQAWWDNGRAASRRDEVRVTLGHYNVQQMTCNDDACSITSDDASRFLVRADRVNLGQALVVLFRRADGRAIWSTWARVTPYGTAPGGWIAVKTGALDCSGGASTAPNAYFRVKDGSSGRWSSPQYLTTGCATL